MIAEPVWVESNLALAIHQRQLAEHGGLEGVRDEGLLESALAKPRNLNHYSSPEPSLAEMAAAYAYGIARNHPFVDGNERSALVMCRVFLKLNGLNIDATRADKYQTVMKLASGEVTEQELADWIASRCVGID